MKQYNLIQWNRKGRELMDVLAVTMPSSTWLGTAVIIMLLLEVQTYLLTVVTVLYLLTGFFQYNQAPKELIYNGVKYIKKEK